MASLKLGDNQYNREGTSAEAPSQTASREQVAKRLGISDTTIERVRRARQKGIPRSHSSSASRTNRRGNCGRPLLVGPLTTIADAQKRAVAGCKGHYRRL